MYVYIFIYTQFKYLFKLFKNKKLKVTFKLSIFYDINYFKRNIHIVCKIL
jgi:hypothetical protein